MVYTRWKCDRLVFYGPKYFCHEYLWIAPLWLTCLYFSYKHFSTVSEETERKYAYVYGYPWWRDPIQIKKQEKYSAMIRDNNIDITDPKWTGVPKDMLL
ncbi:alpha-mannosidase 2-like protein [Perkinsela sp. CCAP 1560/4]|nr:alpha-mannosidase 2-like protein [Perkinsela sp. CCAP 1560/4]|eukprot:KNH04879.1 alpha-mannosidase 2-like protein [Perkinsela sp. CCAP 1560/4]